SGPVLESSERAAPPARRAPVPLSERVLPRVARAAWRARAPGLQPGRARIRAVGRDRRVRRRVVALVPGKAQARGPAVVPRQAPSRARRPRQAASVPARPGAAEPARLRGVLSPLMEEPWSEASLVRAKALELRRPASSVARASWTQAAKAA